MPTSFSYSDLQKVEENHDQSLTLAVCSNRMENIRRHVGDYINSLCNGDNLFIILDLEEDTNTKSFRAELNHTGAEIFINGENLGLSASRNIVLESCRTNYLVFIDDDIALSKETLDAIRHELKKGADIVGVRINGPKIELKIPWYISKGQFHYLAIHNPKSRTLSTWGACMGLNLTLVKTSKLTFRVELGRRGRGLQSGDDTTFLREMKKRGAKETFLNEVYVFHNIDRQRISLGYMLRRAYWQGRSEFRRKDSINGLKKEWDRFLDSDEPASKKVLLAILYITCVMTGISREILRL